MHALPGHFRHAIRLLARTPVFTATAILSLAIGVGANSAIFSAGNALIFAPTPGIRDMGSLVDIGRSRRGRGFDTVSYPTFADVRDNSAEVFTGVYAMRLGPEAISLGTADGSERVYAEQVSGGYFDVLGVQPALGAVFHAVDERLDVPLRTVVLSHAFWQRRFASDPAVVGRPVVVNGEAFTITGVAQEGFRGSTVFTPDLWLPLTAFAKGMPQPDMFRLREGQWLVMGGRLKPGVSVEQARAAMVAFGQRLAAAHPEVYRDRSLATVAASRVPGHAVEYGVPMLALLLGLTGLVLLVACTNLAGLLLARSAARARETAIRFALGASRRSVFTLLMTESVLLALAGGMAGLLVAVWSRGALASLTALLPLPASVAVPVDWRILTFTTVLTICAAILAGAVPAWQGARLNLATDLKSDSMAPARRRTRHLFVAAQVGCCAVLVTLAGLFARAVGTAAAVDPGLTVEGIDVVTMNLDLAGYDKTDQPRIAEELRRTLGALPGVHSIGLARLIPLQGSTIGLGGLYRPGQNDPADAISADWNVISPEYLSTVGIPVLRGRPFTPADQLDALDVAIVNERFAAAVWPGGDAIGQIVEMGDFRPGRNTNRRALRIVGIVRDSRSQWIGEIPGPFIYVPYAQHSTSELNFFVRRHDAFDANSLERAMRTAIRGFNPYLPVVHIASLAQHASLGLLPQRIAAGVASVLGLVALLLAAIGIYGVVAYTVVARTREIGVRVALGADGRHVVWTVLRQCLLVVSVGGMVGLVIAAGAGQLARGLLFGVSPVDPLALAGAGALLTAIAGFACIVPARRATQINPIVALRAE